jgi:D-3-phosphoglycerate dehydrogenase
MKFRIALGDSSNLRPYGEYLKSTGLDIVYVPTRTATAEETLLNLRGFDGAVAGGEKFPKEVIDALSDRLRIICRFGLGFEMVDIAAAEQNGICVTNAAGTMAAGVAECAFLLMLEALRGFAKFDADIQAGIWERSFRGSQLEGKTIGIVGFGSIGQKFARYCSGFNCRLIAYDVRFDEQIAKRIGVQGVSLEELASQSDVVSLHCPLMPETEGMIGRAFLARMKRTAYLVNSARGGLIDEPELVEALRSSRIAGAGLDVFVNEPLEKDSGLRGLRNVVMTPHIASRTFESLQECAEDVSESLHSFLRGEVPRHCLNTGYVHNVRR